MALKIEHNSSAFQPIYVCHFCYTTSDNGAMKLLMKSGALARLLAKFQGKGKAEKKSVVCALSRLPVENRIKLDQPISSHFISSSLRPSAPSVLATNQRVMQRMGCFCRASKMRDDIERVHRRGVALEETI